MTNYTVVVKRDDTGEQLDSFSDSVAEGESDTIEIVVEDPAMTATISQTAGN